MQVYIANLLIQDTGTYNRQYSRPYEAKTTEDSLSVIGDRVAQVTRSNPMNAINGNLISGLCGNLVVPSATWDHELYIPNGWNEQRFRFCMEVHVEAGAIGKEIYFFQGYTDHAGISIQGTIDPNMVFYVNSFIKINRAIDYSGLSSSGFRDTIVESAQVIDGRIHSQMAPQVYGLRPEDLFAGIQSNYLREAYRIGGHGSMIDDRTNKSLDVLSSRRSNGIPSNFLAKVVESHRHATALADYGGTSEDVYSRAIQNSFEGGVFENPFMRMLSNNRDMANVSTFTMNDLAMVDSTVNQRTSYQKLMETVRLHQVGDTDDLWGAATLETQLATIMTHAVSGLMLSNMLVSVGFNVTNMTLDRRLETRLFPGGQAVTTADMRQYYANFVRRLETEVMPDITLNNTLPVNVTVYADLYGETTVQLTIEGGLMQEYVTPSFCDALMAPVVTTNSNDYHGLVQGIEEIVNYCGMTSNSNQLQAGKIITNI